MTLGKADQAKTSNSKSAIYALIIAIVLCLIYWPALRWMVNSWLSSDYYSHGFLVPVVSAVIIWTKREHLKIREQALSGIIWILAGAVLYALDLILEIQALGALSLIMVIVGLIWFFWGPRVVKVLAFPLVFLLFMVPFPFTPDVAYRLQQISVFSSSHLLEILRFPVSSSGAEIQLQGLTFSVGIPCSGIDSLTALLALAAVYTYILLGSFGKRLGLFLLAIPIAIIANILRITSIIMVAYFVNVQTAAGWYHDISSPIFFLLAFLAVILGGWIMKCKINYGILRKQ